MDRNLAKWFSVYSHLDLSYDGRELHKSVEPEKIDSALKSVLDEIFAVDPVSGFPKGDIQYYLSSEGNPQVKQWLENNLLKPRMTPSSSLQDVSDDLRVEFSRGANESISDYQARLMSLYDKAKDEYSKSLNPPDNE